MSFKALNLALFILILFGISLRKNRRIHPPFMVGCFVLDLLMVLGIEFQREAIHTTLTFNFGPLLGFHIFISTLCLLIVNPMVLLSGWKKLKGTGGESHLSLARVFISLRAINLMTSFMVGK